MAGNVKSANDVMQEKAERVLDGVAYWASFYLCNPHRFVKDYLNINLKLFQKILLYAMMNSTNFMLIASRGIGKTWLSALYCVVICILRPGTKIVACSGVKSQGVAIIEKIEKEFLKAYGWGSANLRNEISFISTGVNNAGVEFKNGSFIKIVTSNSNARSNRANLILVDEFRMVDPDVINTVLRRFLTAPRHPGYLDNPKYAHLAERNMEMYLSSAWYKSHWSYEKFKSYFANMLDSSKKYFVCCLGYQLAIKEGLLSRDQIMDEKMEEDFDEIAFSIEMESMFYGDSDGAFYRYDDIEKCRKIKNAFFPLEMYEKRGLNVPELSPNERRIMSVDVALMATKKHANDATAVEINVSIPNGSSYNSNIVYIETFEGMTTDELGLTIMRYFYKYKCTDLVLDCQGNGLGVYDTIIRPQFDPSTGETYQALTSCNNPEMAERCKVRNANKVVWCIKASADFNSYSATLLRAGIKNGNINFLTSEFDAEENLKKVSGYKSMTSLEQAKLQAPYVQTTLMINEMINLEHEIVNNKVKLKERSGMRKDRYSALQYSYYVAQELARNLKPRNQQTTNYNDIFKIRVPKIGSRSF